MRLESHEETRVYMMTQANRENQAMSIDRDKVDQMINQHFMYEATDNIEGVLGSLTEDVEHLVVPSPMGPLRGRSNVRAYYQLLFSTVKGEGVTPVRRLYGDDFVIDEVMWHGFVEDGRAFLCPGKSGK